MARSRPFAIQRWTVFVATLQSLATSCCSPIASGRLRSSSTTSGGRLADARERVLEPRDAVHLETSRVLAVEREPDEVRVARIVLHEQYARRHREVTTS